MHLSALVGNDERALKLAGILRVDAEIRLQWHFTLDTGRNVYERPTRPHGRVQRRKLVVAGRNDRAEILLDEIWVLAHRSIHVAKENSLSFKVFAVLVVNNLRLVLSGDPCEILALCLGNTEFLIRAHHFFWEFIPFVNLFARRLQVVIDVLKIDVRHVLREPLSHRLAVKQRQ